MSDFSFLVDPEAKLNLSLIKGHVVLQVLALAGATNPRLYAEPNVTQGTGDLFIPETALEKAAAWTDTSRNLSDMGVPQDLAIDLSYAVDQDLEKGGPPIERNAAQMYALLTQKDRINGVQRFLDANPFLPNRNVMSIVAELPGVEAAVGTALDSFAKPR